MSTQPTPGASRAATIIQTKLNATLRRAGFITSDSAKTIPGPAEIRARAMIAEDIDREAVKPATEELLSALRNIADVAAKMSEQSGSAQAAFVRDEARAVIAKHEGRT